MLFFFSPKYLQTKDRYRTDPALHREPQKKQMHSSVRRLCSLLLRHLQHLACGGRGLLLPVCQEGHRPLMPVFVCHRPHAGRFHDHVIDNPCGEKSITFDSRQQTARTTLTQQGRSESAEVRVLRRIWSRTSGQQYLCPCYAGVSPSHRPPARPTGPGLTSSDEEVGHHHQRVNGHGRGHVHPARPLQLDVGALEHGEGQAVQRLHGGGAAQRTAAAAPRPPRPAAAALRDRTRRRKRKWAAAS